MTESDEDALWRSIVENYGDRVTLEVADDPSAPAPRGPRSTPDPDPNDAAPPLERRKGDADRSRDVDPDPIRDISFDATAEPDRLDAYDDPDDHFVPPEPPSVPAPAPPRLLAWVGVLGVPMAVLLLVLLRVPLPSWGSLLCLGWFVGGFGYLVATMRGEAGTDDDWDDGARL